MQCVSRAGPSRICVTLRPSPTPSRHVLVGDLEAVELELAVPAVLLGPHDRDPAHDAPAGLVAVEQERRESLARIVRRARDQDEVLRDARAGDEPLAAADRPSGRRRVRARVRIIDGSEPLPGCGSVIANARAHAAIGDRREPALLSAPAWPIVASTRMLPSSGAAQLKQTGPKIDSFISS